MQYNINILLLIITLIINLIQFLWFDTFNSYTGLKFVGEYLYESIGLKEYFFVILGVILAEIHKNIQKPNLIFKINTNTVVGKQSFEYMFLNVLVCNKERKGWRAILYGNSNVVFARVWVRYYNDKNEQIKYMDGRWSTLPEPVRFLTKVVDGETKTEKQVDSRDLVLLLRESIPLNESSEITVALKTSGIDPNMIKNVYGFNNKNYFPNELGQFALKDHCLGQEAKYKAQIEVLADGKMFTYKVLINNSMNFSNFYLSDVN